MFIIIGIILWLIIGFCTYLWSAKNSYQTNFEWSDFLFTTCLGLISFIILAIYIFIHKFPDFMEDLLRKINE